MSERGRDHAAFFPFDPQIIDALGDIDAAVW
jgi:hypothetical protein